MAELQKPDLNKPVFTLLPQAGADIAKGVCPTCKAPITGPNDFRDDLSRKEYSISGMCQKCQDSVFNMTAEEEEQMSDLMDSRDIGEPLRDQFEDDDYE